MLNSARLTSIVLAAVFAALLVVCCPALGQSGEGKPNVLFIAVDDLNDWANCLGGRSGVHTPNIDRLAARGVLFTNAHCAAPSCNPSRVSVMTGVRPSTSGIYHNGQEWRRAPRLARAVTIPEQFRAGGYRACGGGKMFHALSWIAARMPRTRSSCSGPTTACTSARSNIGRSSRSGRNRPGCR